MVCNFVGEKNFMISKVVTKIRKLAPPGNHLLYDILQYCAILRSTAIIELSVFDLLPSQAYCLKVKEMDDEEFEAAVSPLLHTHTHRLAICQAYEYFLTCTNGEICP